MRVTWLGVDYPIIEGKQVQRFNFKASNDWMWFFFSVTNRQLVIDMADVRKAMAGRYDYKPSPEEVQHWINGIRDTAFRTIDASLVPLW